MPFLNGLFGVMAFAGNMSVVVLLVLALAPPSCRWARPLVKVQHRHHLM